MNRPTDFATWYAQINCAADLNISELMNAFNAGITPEEMNAQ